MDDLHQGTGRDLNLVVGQKHNATVGGDMHERIEGLRKSVAGISQSMLAPKSWIGSGAVNLFQVVCDMLELLQQMNTQLAHHAHPQVGQPPTNAASVVENSEAATEMWTSTKQVTLN